MQASIRVDERYDAGATVLAVSGELDVAAAPSLSSALNEIIQRGTGDLVVDLAAVSFVDSTGLAVLLNALRRLTRVRRQMALIIGSGAVTRAFQVTRLDWTFDVFDDVESALERSRPAGAGEAAATG